MTTPNELKKAVDLLLIYEEENAWLRAVCRSAERYIKDKDSFGDGEEDNFFDNLSRAAAGEPL